MHPLVGLLGSIVLAEAYEKLTTPKQKETWERFVGMHHGEAGAVLTALGMLGRSPAITLFGAGLMAHDWQDRKEWFRGKREQL